MSKKKNTLKDLDAFLKQQAASLVPPSPVDLPLSPDTAGEQQQDRSIIEKPAALEVDSRKVLYEKILKTVESFPTQTAEDKMLINTILYLKSGDRWKDVIREYWRRHS